MVLASQCSGEGKEGRKGVHDALSPLELMSQCPREREKNIFVSVWNVVENQA